MAALGRGPGCAGRGENVVVATASGKSMVFQAWTLHGIKASSEPTTLVFYPTKALANDQERRWLEACELVGLPRDTIGKINGDVGVNQRDPIISWARVVITTPDVCHAWMTRREFLSRLRNIIDEAHVYEDVFGSNAAYLFRRLAIAAVNAGNAKPPQFVAATATILSPEEHMRKLTGQEFAVVDESRNGPPRHPRELLYLPLEVGQGGAEDQLAALVAAIIEADSEAQVIAFLQKALPAGCRPCSRGPPAAARGSGRPYAPGTVPGGSCASCPSIPGRQRWAGPSAFTPSTGHRLVQPNYATSHTTCSEDS